MFDSTNKAMSRPFLACFSALFSLDGIILPFSVFVAVSCTNTVSVTVFICPPVLTVFVLVVVRVITTGLPLIVSWVT